jgi:hypothetical protein
VLRIRRVPFQPDMVPGNYLGFLQTRLARCYAIAGETDYALYTNVVGV